MGGSEGVGGKGQGAGLGVKGRVGARGEGEKRRNVGKEGKREGGGESYKRCLGDAFHFTGFGEFRFTGLFVVLCVMGGFVCLCV